MKITKHIFLMIVGFTLFSIIIISSFAFNMYFNEISTNIKRELQSKTENTINNISRNMFERSADVKLLGSPHNKIISDKDYLMSEKIKYLHNLEEYYKFYAGISIYDVTGIKIGDTRNLDIGIDESERPFFKNAILGKSFYDDTPVFSHSLNQYIIHFSTPILTEGGKINGVITASFPLIKLNVFMDEFDEHKGKVELISNDGTVIFSNYAPSSVLSKNLKGTQIFEEIENSKEQTIIFEVNDQIIVISKEQDFMDHTGKWYLVVEMPKAVVFSNVYQLRDNSVIVAAGIMVLSVFASFSVARNISNPILSLKDASVRISKGDFSKEITLKGDAEIIDLAKSFNLMRNSLADSNCDLNNLINAVNESDIVAKTDKNGTIIYVNKKFCEISKYTRDELIGKNHRILKSGHHPSEFYDSLWHTIAHGKIWRGEIKNRAKDGSNYWVKTVIVPKIGRNGKPEEYFSIRTDITNRKLSEEHLQQALEKIKQNESFIKMQLEEIKLVEKQKDEFISMISHELKSPLMPIIGYCELLKDTELSKNYTILHLEAIDEISSNAERLERITMDLLDVSKLHMQKLFFDKQNFSIRKFMTSVEKEYSFILAKKQIQFFVNPVDDQILYSDEQRLRQVMDNLIRNSIDFVSEGTGKITIDVSTNSANITFSVQDNGIGIPEEKQKDLFKKFFQVNSTISRNHGGTGLGLVICKGIIKALGGKIWLKSDVGKGTIFYFQLPINSEKQKTDNTQKGISK